MSQEIDYYFTLISPYAYLGHDAFMAVAEKHGATVNFKPCVLGKVFEATGGLPLGKRAPARQAYRWIELQRWREKRNLPLTLQPAYFPADPSLADTCVLAILEAGGDPRGFMERTYRAVWALDKDIADEHVVDGMLADAGHDAHAIVARAKSPEIAAVYQANTDEAIAAGIVGAPGFVLHGEPFWGQDRIELLDDALTSGRAPYRPIA